MNAIIVCVDYWDYLGVTLPINRHHFNKVVIVTNGRDGKTVDVANQNDCYVHRTDSFYDDGAFFNKWKALEEGLDIVRADFDKELCIMDADVVWPKEAPIKIQIGNLYAPYRHMMPNYTNDLPPEDAWVNYSLSRCPELSGYSIMFNIDDPVLRRTPWFQIDWKHAGGADSFFQRKWRDRNRIRTKWPVLHLGPNGRNWCGRSTAYLDGQIPENAEQHNQNLDQLMTVRRKKRDPNYLSERLKK